MSIRRPPRRVPLPVELHHEAFHIQQAAQHGVAYDRLRHDDLVTPTRGVRAREPLSDVTARAKAFALALPAGTAFSHITALDLWGLPVPFWVRDSLVLHVMRELSTPPIRRRGCVSHRGLESREVGRVHGLAVTTPVTSWLDSATLMTRDDLVAVGDALLMPPWNRAQSELATVVALARGRRGVHVAREASALVRVGSASPQESRARCLFMDAGLPEPELNIDLYDERGAWLARSDFVWRERRVVAEYDGDQHRTDARRWQYERERRARLEDAGWVYVEMASGALRRGRVQDELIARLARLLLPQGG